MANKARGEIKLVLGGETYVLVPSFGAVCEIEDKIGANLFNMGRRLELAEVSARDLIDVTGTSSETITVGGGGAGGVAGSNPGTDGNTSSFGAFCSATGGKGAPGSSTIEISGGDGGVGSGGGINIKGSGGDGGPGSAAAPGGPGGGSHLGGGAKGSARNAGGFAGGNYGGGGGGTASSSGSRAGGNGAGGVVIVWEYK